jgi:hypothetical protein
MTAVFCLAIAFGVFVPVMRSWLHDSYRDTNTNVQNTWTDNRKIINFLLKILREKIVTQEIILYVRVKISRIWTSDSNIKVIIEYRWKRALGSLIKNYVWSLN